MEPIVESGMQFGLYSDENVFRIEKSPQYQLKLMPNGVKSCEFILLRDNTLFFIEAKTSSPMEITADTPEEKKKKYNEYISEIVDKMKHSVLLYANILLCRYDSGGVPAKLMNHDLSYKEIKLVLVIKNAEKEWLTPLQEKLRSELRVFCAIWKINGLFVINELTARQKHFVI